MMHNAVFLVFAVITFLPSLRARVLLPLAFLHWQQVWARYHNTRWMDRQAGRQAGNPGSIALCVFFSALSFHLEKNKSSKFSLQLRLCFIQIDWSVGITATHCQPFAPPSLPSLYLQGACSVSWWEGHHGDPPETASMFQPEYTYFHFQCRLNNYVLIMCYPELLS